MKLSAFIATAEGQKVSQAEWARRVAVTRGYFCQLRDEAKTPSLEVAYRIELATGGKVRMQDWVSEGDDGGGLDDNGLRGENPETV